MTPLTTLNRELYTRTDPDHKYNQPLGELGRLFLTELQKGRVYIARFGEQYKLSHTDITRAMCNTPPKIAVYDDKEKGGLCYADCLHRDRIEEVLNGV